MRYTPVLTSVALDPELWQRDHYISGEGLPVSGIQLVELHCADLGYVVTCFIYSGPDSRVIMPDVLVLTLRAVGLCE
jgi:hypothetical protein